MFLKCQNGEMSTITAPGWLAVLRDLWLGYACADGKQWYSI